jgi:hypothetical protein
MKQRSLILLNHKFLFNFPINLVENIYRPRFSLVGATFKRYPLTCEDSKATQNMKPGQLSTKYGKILLAKKRQRLSVIL